MSSSILYVAIVAIWAVVLVPRWLWQDSFTSNGDELTTAEFDSADSEEPAPPARGWELEPPTWRWECWNALASKWTWATHLARRPPAPKELRRQLPVAGTERTASDHFADAGRSR